MASTYLREAVSANGNKKKWTISVWVKRSGLGANTIMSAWYADSTSGHMSFGFDSEDRLDLSTWSVNVLTTNRKFRDTNAWYHIQVAVDTDESTADNRARFYVNGVEETSFSTRNNKSSGFEYSVNNSSSTHNIGGNLYSGTTNLFNGSMSHFHFVDGQQYTPTVFGSTDSTTGEWKINTSPSVTYGTNGFFILKDGNSVTDQSGQGNNLTVQAGTLTKTEDCPSNVFATFNPLYRSSNTANFYNGNTRVTGTDYTNQRTGGTLASNSGKFYFEAKAVGSTDFGGSTVGIYNYDGNNIIMNSNTWFGSSSDYIGFYCSSNVLKVITAGSHDNHGSVSVGDIIGCAFDIDNGYLYLSINGTYVNSGVPTSGSTGTGNVNRTGSHNYDFSGLLMGIAGGLQVTDAWQCNFGNGYFGTTAVSSAGTNASGIGIFEYDVPTGYTALSTKGLNL